MNPKSLRVRVQSFGFSVLLLALSVVDKLCGYLPVLLLKALV